MKTLTLFWTVITGTLFLMVYTMESIASLSVHPSILRDTTSIGGKEEIILHITNQGPANPLGYTISANVSWIALTPASGQISVGDTARVKVTYDASALSPGTYTGTITVVDPHHGPILVSVTFVVTGITDVETNRNSYAPLNFTLHQNYPNPFNPGTEIRYSIARSGPVNLTIFNLLGQEVAVLVDAVQGIGNYSVRWNAASMPSGTYYYHLRTQEFTEVKRMMLLK